ncbi:hypothetical protein GCM10027048_20800 [Hymenobacter coalescens]
MQNLPASTAPDAITASIKVEEDTGSGLVTKYDRSGLTAATSTEYIYTAAANKKGEKLKITVLFAGATPNNLPPSGASVFGTFYVDGAQKSSIQVVRNSGFVNDGSGTPKLMVQGFLTL